LIAQHRQQLKKYHTVIIAGGTVDYSPNTQVANYIKIKKDTILNQYVSYEDRKDSMLTDYRNNILNYAGFVNLEFNPIKNLRIVGALRYDVFRYGFDNNLAPSAFSGSADTTNSFQAWAPKIGFTYDLKNNRGIYANYSRGFVPPQVSELYRGVKVPDLSPSVFDNYEIGGWASVIKDKLSFDVSLYRLEGNNTIISVRFDDGTFGNANAGKTLSQGIELGMTAYPFRSLQIRFSGAYSKHEFLEYIERGVKLTGNQINSAPQFIANAEITYRPDYAKGLRLMAEWQMMSSYFMDPTNLVKYEGFHVMNLRAGYNMSHTKKPFLRGAEVWINVINALDAYYAVNSSRSNFGRNYTLGEPRNINVGVSYDLGSLFGKNSSGFY
jgi:outer membrane receptor protein involved in Fe transport